MEPDHPNLAIMREWKKAPKRKIELKEPFLYGCTGKTRHPNKSGAEVAIYKTPRHVRFGLEPYLCSHCEGWHVGTPFDQKNKPGK